MSQSSQLSQFHLESPSNNNLVSYDDVLKSRGIKSAITLGYYLQVGQPQKSQGWIIHIPVWDIHFITLIDRVIPILLEYKIPFCIPINNVIHSLLQEGALGSMNLGKIIVIFPSNDDLLVTLVKKLIKQTGNLKGSLVPTDFPLGNLVHTKFGSFNIDVTSQDKYVIDNNGILIKDVDSIPPILYDWVVWPFGEISQPIIPKESKILNSKYLIQKVIKPDVKGRVIIGLYQKNLLNFKKCIIKEGRDGMAHDLYGRDAGDRLLWQKLIYTKLGKQFFLPSILDIFREQNNTYLVFEYIKGKTLGDLLVDLYDGHSWHTLTSQKKSFIIQTLIKSFKVIDLIHQKNIVHRDLNIENIFIDKKGEVWILDLELAYDLDSPIPEPPFERGSEGYMSPEQSNSLPPKIEQDIYSIGAIMIMAIIHISPHKFNLLHISSLKQNILFFTKSRLLSNLILHCLDPDPDERPTLKDIIITLEKHFKENDGVVEDLIDPSLNALDLSINDIMRSLNSPKMLSQNGYWVSPISISDSYIGNLRLDTTVYLGFRKGISGILYVIGQLAAANLEINSWSHIWEKNYNLLIDSISQDNNQLSPGLYKGSYGFAIGLASLIQGKLIPENKGNINLLTRCLDQTTTELGISDGLAGYGLALLKCKDILPSSYIVDKLNYCCEQIYSKQLYNGSWNLHSDNQKKLIITGFTSGIAGIVWFLLKYAQVFNDNFAQKIGEKGLHYLIKNATVKKNEYIWKLGTGSPENQHFSNGGYHMLLPFIKAYQLTEKSIYKKIVESNLLIYPSQIIADYSSIERGLAGLGEIYIEAWQAFNSIKWLERAEWIAKVLINSTYNHNEYKYWLNVNPYTPNADLLTGNSGILHFLMKLRYPKIIQDIY